MNIQAVRSWSPEPIYPVSSVTPMTAAFVSAASVIASHSLGSKCLALCKMICQPFLDCMSMPYFSYCIYGTVGLHCHDRQDTYYINVSTIHI